MFLRYGDISQWLVAHFFQLPNGTLGPCRCDLMEEELVFEQTVRTTSKLRVIDNFPTSKPSLLMIQIYHSKWDSNTRCGKPRNSTPSALSPGCPCRCLVRHIFQNVNELKFVPCFLISRKKFYVMYIGNIEYVETWWNWIFKFLYEWGNLSPYLLSWNR